MARHSSIPPSLPTSTTWKIARVLVLGALGCGLFYGVKALDGTPAFDSLTASLKNRALSLSTLTSDALDAGSSQVVPREPRDAGVRAALVEEPEALAFAVREVRDAAAKRVKGGKARRGRRRARPARAPSTPPASWACSGDLSPVAIRKVMRSTEPMVRTCYERQLRNNNTLQGSVHLEVRIDADGAVNGARVHGSLPDKRVRSCVRALARSWSFPKPEGGDCAVFTAPYNFKPKAD